MSPPVQIRRSLVILCWLAAWPWPCAAQRAQHIPLERIVPSSSVVVIARLEKFVADPSVPSTLPTRPEPWMRRADLDALAERRMIRRESGTNYFEVLDRLQGESRARIEFHTGPLSLTSYGSNEFNIPEPSVCLLMLNLVDGRLVPVESTLPFVPLGPSFRMPDDFDRTQPDAMRSVVRILIASLDDTGARTSSLYFLSSTRDNSVVEAAQRVWKDPDSTPFARRNAMLCLAENQVIEIIPHIAADSGPVGMQGTGFTALQRYRTPEAIPALTRLLAEGNNMVQANAQIALNNIGSVTSVGNLVRSLRTTNDPYRVHYDLHRLVPALGTPRGVDHFKAHQEQEIQADERWWAKEQQVMSRRD